MNAAPCTACDAPIRFAMSEANERAMPIDDKPDPKGNLVIVAQAVLKGSGEIVPVMRVITEKNASSVPPDLVRYISHFATCSAAGRFRKKKSPKVKR